MKISAPGRLPTRTLQKGRATNDTPWSSGRAVQISGRGVGGGRDSPASSIEHAELSHWAAGSSNKSIIVEKNFLALHSLELLR